MKNTKKILVLALAAVLLVAVSVGGTVAFLQDRTQEIVNTFTTSNIDITLKESQNLDLKMVPGKALTKDPVVTVIKDSEDCWLFVKVEKTEGFDTYLTYKMADGWTELTDVPGVYYRSVTASSDKDQEFHVIKDDKVTVTTDASLTNEQMDKLEGNNPKMTITAYAIQKVNFDTAKEAWAEVSKLSNNEEHYVTPTGSTQGTTK